MGTFKPNKCKNGNIIKTTFLNNNKNLPQFIYMHLQFKPIVEIHMNKRQTIICYAKLAKPPTHAAQAIHITRPKATAIIDITMPAVAIPRFATFFFPNAPRMIPIIPRRTDNHPSPIKGKTNAHIPNTNDATANFFLLSCYSTLNYMTLCHICQDNMLVYCKKYNNLSYLYNGKYDTI